MPGSIRPFVLLLFAACLSTAPAASSRPAPEQEHHPRLWLTQDALSEVRSKIAKDPLAARLQQAVMKEADQVLVARTCRYEIPDGRRLLRESRLALHNILHAGWAWRFTGDDRYRARVVKELEAACGLKDWNPSHFLDTAEMATAVAVGYDWLFPSLTPDQRKMCREAVHHKALIPASEGLRKNSFWTQPKNNWAQVCGSGITLAAATFRSTDPELADTLIAHNLELIDRCAAFYQPDGMYPEGPGYWHYGTNYHVMLLAARPLLGFGHGRSEEVLHLAGRSIMQVTGPTLLTFNYADSHARMETSSPAQCWIATRHQDPEQAGHVRGLIEKSLNTPGSSKPLNLGPLSLLWLPPAPSANREPPKAALFGGEQAVAVFRTGWNPNAAFIAMKGGTPGASHGHMDVGAFVYDAHGQRWIHDLGSENYNLPGYFGGNRWDYYRLQNRSHNTLEIAGSLQNPQTRPCPVTRSVTKEPQFEASFDLTGAYRPAAKHVTRSVSFNSVTGAATITDELGAPNGRVTWRAFTDADVELSGEKAVLRKQGKSITLIAHGASWKLQKAAPPTPQENQNEGFRALALEQPAAESVRFRVEINP